MKRDAKKEAQKIWDAIREWKPYYIGTAVGKLGLDKPLDDEPIDPNSPKFAGDLGDGVARRMALNGKRDALTFLERVDEFIVGELTKIVTQKMLASPDDDLSVTECGHLLLARLSALQPGEVKGFLRGLERAN